MARDGNEVGWGSFVCANKAKRDDCVINCPDELVKKIVVPEILARLFLVSIQIITQSPLLLTLDCCISATFLFFLTLLIFEE